MVSSRGFAMKYDFDQVLSRQNTDCVKWDAVKTIFGNDEVIPMWVADMDFPAAKPIVDTLDNGEIIPNSSGLAGATDITEAQMQAVMSWLFGIQGDIDTNIAVVVKLIGINANGG